MDFFIRLVTGCLLGSLHGSVQLWQIHCRLFRAMRSLLLTLRNELTLSMIIPDLDEYGTKFFNLLIWSRKSLSLHNYRAQRNVFYNTAEKIWAQKESVPMIVLEKLVWRHCGMEVCPRLKQMLPFCWTFTCNGGCFNSFLNLHFNT